MLHRKVKILNKIFESLWFNLNKDANESIRNQKKKGKKKKKYVFSIWKNADLISDVKYFHKKIKILILLILELSKHILEKIISLAKVFSPRNSCSKKAFT